MRSQDGQQAAQTAPGPASANDRQAFRRQAKNRGLAQTGEGAIFGGFGLTQVGLGLAIGLPRFLAFPLGLRKSRLGLLLFVEQLALLFLDFGEPLVGDLSLFLGLSRRRIGVRFLH